MAEPNDAPEGPEPAVWGIFNPHTGSYHLNVFRREAAAAAHAKRRTNRWTTLAPTPLFGAEALVAATAAAEEDARKAKELAEAQTNAVAVLKGEVVALNNEISRLKGQLMAAKHAGYSHQ